MLTAWLIRTARAEDAEAVSDLYGDSWPGSVDHVASQAVIDALLHERSERFCGGLSRCRLTTSCRMWRGISMCPAATRAPQLF